MKTNKTVWITHRTSKNNETKREKYHFTISGIPKLLGVWSGVRSIIESVKFPVIYKRSHGSLLIRLPISVTNLIYFFRALLSEVEKVRQQRILQLTAEI